MWHELRSVLASQLEHYLLLDVIANSSTKIVLLVDQTKVKRVTSKFRPASLVNEVTKLAALCR